MMAKPSLTPAFAQLEAEIIRTFLAGHHQYRPDLSYPQSHSDMQGGVRALLRRFEIVPRAVPLDSQELVAQTEAPRP